MILICTRGVGILFLVPDLRHDRPVLHRLAGRNFVERD